MFLNNLMNMGQYNFNFSALRMDDLKFQRS